MKTTIPKLRKIIRKVITESMSPSDPDYDTVAEVIAQVNRKVMFGQITSTAQLEEECDLLAADYGVPQHIDYIIERCTQMMERMGF
tara:strand:- start:327 stop:584 length:258 start_codon:yes stop_codon:yes gene_type:complete